MRHTIWLEIQYTVSLHVQPSEGSTVHHELSGDVVWRRSLATFGTRQDAERYAERIHHDHGLGESPI